MTSPRNLQALIILPSYNVSSAISDVLSPLPKSNVLVVDDGSTDETAAIVERLGYRLVKHPHNLGLSAAIKTGEKYAEQNEYRHVVFIDADGQHPSELFGEFLRALERVDFVFGDRFSRLEHIPLEKIASNLFASLLVKEVTGQFVRDVSCGYRGYRLLPQLMQMESCGYSRVYSQIVEVILSGISQARVSIPAIYPPHGLHATKRNEIIGLCQALVQFAPTLSTLSRILDSVYLKKEISIAIDGVSFIARYIEPIDSYQFSTDAANAKRLYANR
ncbi:MAG TPA: glycosyltransferase family 2 protein [Paucimonas sp.]|nr:glycosyltransferase family 2 protein [Paucimonas sp.]